MGRGKADWLPAEATLRGQRGGAAVSGGLSTGAGQQGSHREQQCARKPNLETESQDIQVCNLFPKQK